MKLTFENYIIFVFGWAVTVLAILLTVILLDSLFPNKAHAQVYATQLDNAVVVWQNKCKDLDPNDVYRTGMNEAEYIALTERWACLNSTQASQTPETLRQIKRALRVTKFKKQITIYSQDPEIGPKNCNPDLHDGNCTWKSGAWYINKKLYFANSPGCPNARRVLERVLRALK